MTLTAYAQALQEPLSDALDRLEGLLRTAEFDPATVSRRFRLSLSDYSSRIMLPPLARHVRQHAPGLHLAISQATRDTMVVQLIDGEIDLAFGVFPSAPEGIQVQTLFDDRFVSLADKAVLPARGGLCLDDWLQRPHVRMSMHPDATDEIEQTLASLGLRRCVAMVLPHWSAAAELLPGTDLILTVASRAVGPMQRHRALRKFAPPLELPPLALQLAWHARRDADPIHRWLRQSIFDCMHAVRQSAV